MNDYKMTPGERRATWGLGTVFSLRMLGMFMVLPVLTTYGMALQGASEALIGIAIGIYDPVFCTGFCFPYLPASGTVYCRTVICCRL